MVAIFTGAGTGFERGSGSVVGSMGLLGGASIGRGGEQVFLNAANGNLMISRRDEFLVGRGPDVAIARTYNSKGDLSDDNADNWRQSTDRRVYGVTGTLNQSGSVKRVSADGSVITYSFNSGNGRYVATDGPGAEDNLTYNSGAQTWTWVDGDSRIVERYEAHGTTHGTPSWRIVEESDLDGNKVTFTYAGDHLDRVTTADGGYTQYGWSGNAITAISTGYYDAVAGLNRTLTRASYGYDASGRLETVTVDLTPANTGDSATYTTTYTYDGTSTRVASIAQSDGSLLSIAYDGVGRVLTLTQAVAAGSARVTALAYHDGYTTVTDPTGQVTRLNYNSDGSLAGITTPSPDNSAPGHTVSFVYNSSGDLVSVTEQAADPDQAVTPEPISAVANTTVTDLGDGLTRIEKTSGDNGLWDASASSSTGLSGDFVLRMRPAQADKWLMAGVSTDPHASNGYGDLDYGFYVRGDGYLWYRQSGSWGSLGHSYQAGDNLWIERIGTTVSWYVGGTLASAKAAGALRTVGGAIGTLYFDSSFMRLGGRLDVTFTSPPPPTPEAVENTTVTQLADGLTRIQKTGGDNSLWDASATSSTGVSGDFVLRMRPAQANKWLMAGVSAAPFGNSGYHEIDYGFYVRGDGLLWYRQSGAWGSLGHSYQAGDNLWIERIGTTVSWYVGDTLASAKGAGALRSVGGATGTLYFDSSFMRVGGILDVSFASPPPAPEAVANTTVTQLADGLTRIEKTGGDNSLWDASASSAAGLAGDFVLRMRPAQADKWLMAGVSTSPFASSSYHQIDYGFYFRGDGYLWYRQSGSWASLGVSYQAGDNLWIERKGATVSWYIGDTLQQAKSAGALRSVGGATGTLYFDSSFMRLGGKLDVSFTPPSPPAVSRTYDYDQLGNIVSETDRLGALVDRTYGSRNERLTETRRASYQNGTNDLRTTRYAHDAENHLRYVVTEEGRVTEYRYDAHGRQVSKIDHAARYDVTGLSASASIGEATLNAWISANADRSTGNRTDYFYDHRGNLTDMVTYAALSAFGEGASSPHVITPGRNTVVTAEADGMYRIVKATGATLGYDADAHSSVRADGDFVLELRPSQTDKEVVAGVATSPATDAGAADPDYAFFFNSNGRLYFRESGDITYLDTPYSTSNSYWIVREGDALSYYAGATLASAKAAGALRTIAGETRAFYFDSSLRVPGAGLSVGFTPQPITNSANTTVTRLSDGLTRIRKTSGDDSAWDASATSSTGASGDFVLRMRPPQANEWLIAGVSTAPDASHNYNQIDYGLYFRGDGYLWYRDQNGMASLGRSYAAGDNFWLVRSGTTVSWYAGSTLAEAKAAGALRTVSGATGSYHFDSSFMRVTGALDVDFTPALPASVELTRTHFTYDQAGNLLSRYAEGQNPETFVYDGLGRMIASTDVNGGTTTILFHDAATKTVVALAEGLVRTSTYNKAGELVASTESGKHVQPTAATNAAIATTSDGLTRVQKTGGDTSLWDASAHSTAGASGDFVLRLRPAQADKWMMAGLSATPDASSDYGEIDYGLYFRGDGYLWYRDSSGMGTLGRSYAAGDNFWIVRTGTTVSWYQGATLAEAMAAGAFWTKGGASGTLYFDSSFMRLGAAVDIEFASGLAPTPPDSYLYDRNGRLRVATDSTGRTSYFVYDRLGRKIAEADETGAVTEYRYDSFDRLVATIRFYDKLSAASLAILADPNSSPNMASIRPALHDSDIGSWRFYDKEGRLVQTIDGSGGVVDYQYDKSHQLVRTIAYASKVGVAGFKTSAPIAPVAPQANAADDRVTRTFYDRDGNLLGVLDGRGFLTRYFYDWTGRKTSELAYASVAPSSLRAEGTLWQLRDAVQAGDQRWTRRLLDRQGLVRFEIDAADKLVEHVYDRAGNRTTTIRYAGSHGFAGDYSFANAKAAASALAANPANRVDWTVYDPAGRAAYAIDPEGSVTAFAYDNLGQVVRTVQYAAARATASLPSLSEIGSWAGAQASNGANRVTRIWYGDRPGEIRFIVDAEGYVSRFDYDAEGRRIGEARWDNPVAATDATTVGQIAALASASGGHTYAQLEYDDAGRLTVRRDAAGTAEEAATTYVYNALGQVAATVDPRGHTEYYYYDPAGRRIMVRDAEDHVTETSYTAFGDVASVTRRYNKATNAAGIDVPPVVAGHAKDATTSFAYSRMGHLWKVTDAEGHLEEYGLNAFGERVTVRNKLGGVVTNTFDARGLLIAETLPMASVRADGTTQATSVTNRYEYDAFGNRTKTIEASGLTEQRTTIFVYDRLSRLVEKRHDEVSVINPTTWASLSNVTPVERFAYDAFGNLIESVDANGARSLFYHDRLGRTKVELDAVGTYRSYSYDENGNVLASRVYGSLLGSLPSTPGGSPPAAPGTSYRETRYGYDRLDRLTSTSVDLHVTGAWSGSAYVNDNDVTATSHVEYDVAGNVVRTIDALGHAVYSYYDKLGRKTSQIDTEGYRTGWAYDAEGNVTVERRNAVRYTGALSTGSPPVVATDPADRLTYFDYDRNGRRVSEKRINVTAYTVNGSGQLVTASTDAIVGYAYNGLGQVISKTEATGEASGFIYDSVGRLIVETRAARADQNGATVTPSLRYRYDGLDNLTYVRQGDITMVTGDRATGYTYGAGGRLESMTDANGKAHSYYYDAAGNLLRDSYSREKADGTTVLDGILYTRDLLGRVVRQQAATWVSPNWIGDFQTIEYNAYGDVARRGLNGLVQEEFAYDEEGRVIRTNSGDGVWRFFAYDNAGNRTLTIESEGADLAGMSLWQAITAARGTGATVGVNYVDGINSTIHVLDRRGLETQTRLPERQLTSTTRADLSISRLYNAFGEVTRETDARGYATDFTYNAMGRLTKVERPTVSWTNEQGVAANARPTENYYYDLGGRLAGYDDANGNRTTRALLAGTGYGDSEALVTAEFHPDTGVFRTYHDVYGDARILRNELNQDELRFYDAMGRMTEQRHRGGLLRDYYAYDLLGQRIKHTNNLLGASNAEVTDYDAQGRVTRQVAFGGDTTTTSYAWSSSLATSGMGTFGGWTETTTYANGRTLTESSDMFGRMLSKNDLGSHVFSYAYDRAGRLTSQAVTGETTTWTYFNTGLASGVSNASGSAAYGYDAAGNKTNETTTRGGQTVQNATAAFDAMGRMTSWAEAGSAGAPAAGISYEYDKAGNVRRNRAEFHVLDANGNAAGGAASIQDHWYRYDTMNRAVLTKGQLSGTSIVRGTTGTSMLYNVAGQRTSSTRDLGGWVNELWWHFNGQPMERVADNPEGGFNWTKQWIPIQQSGTRTETYEYGADGHLDTVRISENGGTAAVRAAYVHDAMGRLTSQIDYAANGVTAWQRTVSYNGKGQVQSDTVDQKQGSDIFRNVSTYNYGSGSGYALGAATSVATQALKNGNDAAAPDTLTTNAYIWWDGAVQSSVAYDSDTGSGSNPVWNTTYNYSASGQLSSVSVADGRPRSIAYTNDMLGQVIRRDESDYNPSQGDPHEIWYRFNGKQLGYVGNNGTLETDYHASIDNRQLKTPDEGQTGAFRFNMTSSVGHADFGMGVAPINSFDQGNAAGSYTVRAGDTLATIAATLWGDSSLWYKLAEANGMGAAAALVEGQTIAVPQGVMRNAHNAGTFRPYDPAETIGDTSPTNPKPNKSSNKCGVFGQILLVAVAVAVTAITAGAAVAAVAPGIKTFGVAMAALAAGKTGLGAGALIGIGAAAGAAGSIASQGLGVATGIRDKFSWKSVALAGLSGGIGGGLGAAFPGGGFLAGAARGALGSAITQGIGVATGLQSKFDWAGVAAAGAGGGVSSWTGAKLDRSFGAGLAANTAGGIANAAVRTLANGSSFGDNLIAALPDVIGITIGNMIAQGVAGGGSKGLLKKEPQSEAEARIIIAQKEATAREIVAAKEAMLAVPAEAAEFPQFRNPIRDAFEGLFRDAEAGRRDLMQRIKNLPADAANALADSMRGSEARDITSGESQRLRRIFGNRIDLSDVRIVNGAGSNPAARYALFVEERPAITFGNTVYVRPDLYVTDMSVGRENIARLAHEFAHVMQFQQLGFSVVIGRIAAENARYGQREVYNYRNRNTTYHTETLEGQAQMVGDYGRMRETGSWRNQMEFFRSLTQKLRGSGVYGL